MMEVMFLIVVGLWMVSLVGWVFFVFVKRDIDTANLFIIWVLICALALQLLK
jgi:hypothetical protein